MAGNDLFTQIPLLTVDPQDLTRLAPPTAAGQVTPLGTEHEQNDFAADEDLEQHQESGIPFITVFPPATTEIGTRAETPIDGPECIMHAPELATTAAPDSQSQEQIPDQSLNQSEAETGPPVVAADQTLRSDDSRTDGPSAHYASQPKGSTPGTALCPTSCPDTNTR